MFRIEVSVKPTFPDPEGERLEKDIRDIGISTVEQVRVSDVYLLDGQLDEAEMGRSGVLLADPVVEDFSWGEGPLSSTEETGARVVEVASILAWQILWRQVSARQSAIWA